MAQSLQPFWGRARPRAAFNPLAGVPVVGALTQALFIPHKRAIGAILADVTIEESGSDDVQITEHPVEQGAPIADHAFKRPATLQIRAGWTAAHGDLSAETGVYGKLLAWQAALTPFDIVSGKRSYSHMLIERLTIVTDSTSEYALMAQISCKQVIIVNTQTTQVASANQSTTQSGNPDDHAEPAATAPENNKGDQPKVSQATVTKAPVETVTRENLPPIEKAATVLPPQTEIPVGVEGTTGVVVPIPPLIPAPIPPPIPPLPNSP